MGDRDCSVRFRETGQRFQGQLECPYLDPNPGAIDLPDDGAVGYLRNMLQTVSAVAGVELSELYAKYRTRCDESGGCAYEIAVAKGPWQRVGKSVGASICPQIDLLEHRSWMMRLKSSDPTVRSNAVGVSNPFVNTLDTREIEPLFQLLGREHNRNIRWQTTRRLAEGIPHPDSRLELPLIELLQNGDTADQAAAVKCLSVHGAEKALKVLIPYLATISMQVSEAMAMKQGDRAMALVTQWKATLDAINAITAVIGTYHR